jgi:UMF1 family MFS transporter
MIYKNSINKLSIFSWCLYDFANTSFYINIISIYFALWVVNIMGSTDRIYAFANSFSMLLVLIFAPILGSISDKSNKKIKFLIITSCSCALATSLIGINGLKIAIMLFIVANFMQQCALVFYDSLLPSVSNTDNQGRIGSIGVALGYIGALFGIGISILFIDSIGYIGIFRITALLFIITAIPSFIFVKEKININNDIKTINLYYILNDIKISIVNSKKFPGLRNYLYARLLYSGAINAFMVFGGIYVSNELGFTQENAQYVLMAAIISAILASFLWGSLVDKIGPLKSLKIDLSLWIIVLIGGAYLAYAEIHIIYSWILFNLAGVAISGIWTTDRPYLLTLSTPEYVGQFFGLYSMVGRISSIIGFFVWGYITDGIQLGRPVAVIFLAITILISLLILNSYNRINKKVNYN